MPLLWRNLRHDRGHFAGRLRNDRRLHGLLPADCLFHRVRAWGGAHGHRRNRMKSNVNQSAALLRLLSDEDPATVALVKAQLAHGGPETLEDLRSLEELADVLAAFHLRDVIAEIEEHSAGRIFTDLCARFGEHGDLEEAAWRLAA